MQIVTCGELKVLQEVIQSRTGFKLKTMITAANNLLQNKILIRLSISLFVLYSFSFTSCNKELTCVDCKENEPPRANAGADQEITLPINSVTLDGSASTDPDNNIATYLWLEISGPSLLNVPNGNLPLVQVTNLVKGTYLFELKVTDSRGLFSKDTMQVSVNGYTAHSPCDSTQYNFKETIFQNIAVSPFVLEEATNTYWGSAVVSLQQVNNDNKNCLRVFLIEHSYWREVPLYVLGPSYFYFTVTPGVIKIMIEKSAAPFINPAGDLVSVKVIYPQ